MSPQKFKLIPAYSTVKINSYNALNLYPLLSKYISGTTNTTVCNPP